MTSHQPGVKFVQDEAFDNCVARTDVDVDVECSELAISNNYWIRGILLAQIFLPSARNVEALVSENSEELTEVKFGSKLKSIEEARGIHLLLSRIFGENCHPIERWFG